MADTQSATWIPHIDAFPLNSAEMTTTDREPSFRIR